jgi:hypothetical protein
MAIGLESKAGDNNIGTVQDDWGCWCWLAKLSQKVWCCEGDVVGRHVGSSRARLVFSARDGLKFKE